MLEFMTTNPRVRPTVRPSSPGTAIRARRIYLGLQQDDIVARTGGVINAKLLSRLENDHVHPGSLRLGKYRALLTSLEWTPQEFEEATGVAPATADDDFPSAEPYLPTHRVPVAGTVSAGLKNVTKYSEFDVFLPIDGEHPAIRGREHLFAFEVDRDALVSDAAARMIPPHSMIIVELSAEPSVEDLVIAWLPERNRAVVMHKHENEHAIVHSYSPSGPVYRLGGEIVDVRGVVRMIQVFPSSS